MVSLSAKPVEISRTVTAIPGSRSEVAAGSKLSCLRCGARLLVNYGEPQCLKCGFVDYSRTVESGAEKGKNLISAATRYVLRYCGDFPALNETLAQVRLVRIRNRVGFDVTCPFCNQKMEESSLSGKRPEVREQRYKCKDGHRVSILPARNGMLAWR